MVIKWDNSQNGSVTKVWLSTECCWEADGRPVLACMDAWCLIRLCDDKGVTSVKCWWWWRWKFDEIIHNQKKFTAVRFWANPWNLNTWKKLKLDWLNLNIYHIGIMIIFWKNARKINLFGKHYKLWSMKELTVSFFCAVAGSTLSFSYNIITHVTRVRFDTLESIKHYLSIYDKLFDGVFTDLCSFQRISSATRHCPGNLMQCKQSISNNFHQEGFDGSNFTQNEKLRFVSWNF